MRALCFVVLLVASSALAQKKKTTPPPPPPPVEKVEKKETPPPPPPVEKKESPPPVEAKKSEPVPLDHTIDPKPENVASVERVGITLELWGESSRMSGEQWINNARIDESFDYGAGPLAMGVYVLFQPWDRVRVGPALRFMGNYGEGGGNGFTFGYMVEGTANAEWSIRAFEKFDVVLGGRAGVSGLVPGEEFAAEIRRLQDQGAAVWSLPRIGWIAGLNAGLRRQIAGRLYGRLDLGGQLGHQWLFSTDQIVEGLRFRKFWGNDIRRLSATLAVEVAL